VILKVRSLEYIAANTYADDRAMAVYLGVVIALLPGHCSARHLRAGGVQRQHAHQQIGTRRAVVPVAPTS